MLELNQYSVHENLNLADFFLVAYVIIDDIYHQTIPDTVRFRRNYNQAKLSDSEIITLAIVCIQTKILAHNLCYLMNKCLGKDSYREIGQIKYLLFG